MERDPPQKEGNSDGRRLGTEDGREAGQKKRAGSPYKGRKAESAMR